jgi:hypothetical protein
MVTETERMAFTVMMVRESSGDVVGSVDNGTDVGYIGSPCPESASIFLEDIAA